MTYPKSHRSWRGRAEAMPSWLPPHGSCGAGGSRTIPSRGSHPLVPSLVCASPPPHSGDPEPLGHEMPGKQGNREEIWVVIKEQR